MIHKEDRYKLENEHNIKRIKELGFSTNPTEVKMFLGESNTVSIPYDNAYHISLYKESNRPLTTWDYVNIPPYEGRVIDYPIETLRVNYRHYSDNPHNAKEDCYELKYVVSEELSNLIRAINYENSLRVESAEAQAQNLSAKVKGLKAEIKDLTDSYTKIANDNLRIEKSMIDTELQLSQASFITRLIRLFSPTYEQKGL